MKLENVENKAAAKVYASKVPHVIVKTKIGLRITMHKLFKSNSYERMLTLVDGKCISYDSKGTKTRTIQKPKAKKKVEQSEPIASGGSK